LAAILSFASTSILFAIWHDPATIAAINGSGGLEEALVLPHLLILPGMVFGGIGGLLGATAKRLLGAAG
jgi:hypothetical protein